MNNPYNPPSADISNNNKDELTLEYVGFWSRAGATIVDTILIIAITYPLLYSIYGLEYFSPEKGVMLNGISDFIISYILPFIAVVGFWIYKSATPGKMAISAKIVDARTGEKPSKGQLIGRYFGYYASFIPLGLGILWIAWDKKKQGWHDKLAHTIVIRKDTNT